MLTITLLSLVVAAASGAVAWRSIRREHLRSRARIASLAAVIDERSRPTPAAMHPAFGSTVDTEIDPALEFPEEAPAASAQTLTFEAIGREPSLTRRLFAVVAGAAVVVAGVVIVAMMSDRYESPAPRAAALRTDALELLSLDASRDGATLAVSGLVRSRAGEPLTSISAVVSAIDAKGRPIGRASVPLAEIMPGDESRFLVTIADAAEAARYRVSFRSASGVIRHVDRRSARSNESRDET